MKLTKWGVGAVVLAAVLAGCKGDSDSGNGSNNGGSSNSIETKATVKIESRAGSTLTGEATFVQKDGKVTFTVKVEGATPGEHAVHIHEKGDCSAPDAKSAGGHWNPMGKKHGKWGEGEFHLGDIGNIKVGEDGKGTLSVTTDLWAVGGGGQNDVVGKSVVVHAKADDFVTDPTGNAGDRQGCGVIEAAK